MKKNILIAFFAALFLSSGLFAQTQDRGTEAFQAGNFDKAIEEFTAYFAANPYDFKRGYMMGLSLEKVGRKEEALNHLRKAYDLNPNDLSIKKLLDKLESK